MAGERRLSFPVCNLLLLALVATTFLLQEISKVLNLVWFHITTTG